MLDDVQDRAKAYAEDLQRHIKTFSEPQGRAYENYILALNGLLLDGKDEAFAQAVLSRMPEGMRQRLIAELEGRYVLALTLVQQWRADWCGRVPDDRP